MTQLLAAIIVNITSIPTTATAIPLAWDTHA